jgi:hypothetical protein
MKPTQKKSESKFDSHCVVCKKPAHSPKGNYNAKRATLCKSVKCRHLRKIELQRARRAQKELFGKLELRAVTSTDGKKHKAVEPSTHEQAPGKVSTGDNSRVNDELHSAAQSRLQQAREARHNAHTSRPGGKKPRRGKHVTVL